MKFPDITREKLPDYLEKLFQRMPLVSIGNHADLSEESVRRFLAVLDEDVKKFAELKFP